MSGRGSKVKGSTFEREVVNYHRDLGVPAERVPLSGALKGEYASDVLIGDAKALRAECKRRARAYKDLYDALAQDDSDMLFIRADRKPTLVVLPLDTYKSFLTWMGWIK